MGKAVRESGKLAKYGHSKCYALQSFAAKISVYVCLNFSNDISNKNEFPVKANSLSYFEPASATLNLDLLKNTFLGILLLKIGKIRLFCDWEWGPYSAQIKDRKIPRYNNNFESIFSCNKQYQN